MGRQVDKAVATITTEAYANGALGGNTVANNGWASSDQIESSEAGTHQWVWDSIGGLQTQDADGKSNGYFKVEVWWMNALGEEGNQTPATLTIDKVDFYDKAGDLLATYPAAADTDTKPAEPKPIQTKADISFTDKKTPSYTYTVKGDIDTLNVDVALQLMQQQLDQVGTIGALQALLLRTPTVQLSTISGAAPA